MTAFRFVRVFFLSLFLMGSGAAPRLAAASPFHFATGDPDGKIATATRPGPASGANLETESADDFVLTEQTVITHATFTGLVPSGVSVPSDISEVLVEIYRVFPSDSNTDRTSGSPTFSTSAVPTRANSPSDVVFDARDNTTGGLTFTVTVLSGSFAAQNSVDEGIHSKPNQTTGGDGPVVGQEVSFDVTFTTPFDLPADHYFFVPQILLSDDSKHFLWLSAPKPIASPGTPFSPDLQSWIRNAQLDPDWLRIGTDIVGGDTPPTFNAAFSLDGETGVTPPPTATPGGVLAGDCSGGGHVTVADIITLVNIVLGNAMPSACPHGVPSGAEVSITLIIQAVNNALNT